MTRVLDALGVPATVSTLADAALEATVVGHGADGGPAGGRDAALAVRSDRARRPLRELAQPPRRVTEAGGIAGGLDVLFWQATQQVELMTGQPAPIGAMRAALDAAVGPR